MKLLAAILVLALLLHSAPALADQETQSTPLVPEAEQGIPKGAIFQFPWLPEGERPAPNPDPVAYQQAAGILKAYAPGQSHYTAKASSSENAPAGNSEGMVGVIVYFRDQAPEKTLQSSSEPTIKTAADMSQMRLLESSQLEIEHVYSVLNGFSGKVSEDRLAELRKNPNLDVHIDGVKHLFLDESAVLVNAATAWNFEYNGTKITGAGEAACVIDDGIDYRHPALGNCTEQEFLSGNCEKVPGGADFVDNDPNPLANGTAERLSESHGSHVAGIIASTHRTYRGMSPDAKIIPVRACNAQNCRDSSIIAGIDWCVENAERFNISVISMSIGSINTLYSTYCDGNASEAHYVRAVNNATARNVSVVAATGNGRSFGGISSPACIRNIIAVGGTDKSDGFYLGGNINNITDLVAPGVSIRSVDNSGGFRAATGTSASAPHVSGAILLLRQYLKLTRNVSANSSMILETLNRTGARLRHPCFRYRAQNGSIATFCPSLTLSRIDVEAALNSHNDVVLNLSTREVGEGSGAANVTVSADVRNRAASSPEINVSVSVSSGSASEGEDFAAVPAFNITIPAGGNSSAANFTLAAINDTSGEANETVIIKGSLEGLVAGYAIMKIIDDDADYDADDDRLIEISNAAQLNAMRWDLNGNGSPSAGNETNYSEAFPGNNSDMGCPPPGCTGYELGADRYSAQHINLDTNGNGFPDANDDYWNGGLGWKPIGSPGSPFNATFNANLKTISYLFINRSSSSHVGLFGSLGSNAAVRNLDLSGVNVTGNESVGGLAGSGNGSSINLVQVSGSVSGSSYVGAVAGKSYGSSINNSRSLAAVSGTKDHVGGIVGQNAEGNVTLSLTAERIYVLLGTLFVRGQASIAGRNFVGGIAGSNDRGTINETLAIVNASGSSSIGGIAGSSSAGLVSTSNTLGIVSGNSSIGGIAGSSSDGNKITFSYSRVKADGNSSIGGIAGSSSGGSFVTAVYSTGRISGTNGVGGIAGSSSGGSFVTAVYSTGRVSGTDGVGGIAGINAESSVSYSYSTASVIGENGAGGLTGTGNGSVTDSYFDSSTSLQPGDGSVRKTTEELHAPTSYGGIYVSWNVDTDDADGDSNLSTGGDSPWDFGNQRQYPALIADFNNNGSASWEEFGVQIREGPALTGTNTESQVRLSWSAVNTSHWPRLSEVRYAVYRNGEFAELVNGTTYNDSGLTSGATYAYQIASVFNGGEPSRSSEKRFTLPSSGSGSGGGGGRVRQKKLRRQFRRRLRRRWRRRRNVNLSITQFRLKVLERS